MVRILRDKLRTGDIEAAAECWLRGWDTKTMSDILRVEEGAIYNSMEEIKSYARSKIAAKGVQAGQGREPCLDTETQISE